MRKYGHYKSLVAYVAYAWKENLHNTRIDHCRSQVDGGLKVSSRHSSAGPVVAGHLYYS